MSIENLLHFWNEADEVDRREGKLAYSRYRLVLEQLLEFHSWAGSFEQALAAFVALSPNNDYIGNLRSLVTLIVGVQASEPVDSINTATYRHCLERAYGYITGTADFLSTVKGKKIRAFYFNILDPSDPQPVTIDGHMSAAWRGKALTMKEALVRPRDYELIADDVRRLAEDLHLLPNQLQATIWFARKRTLNIKYQPQLTFFQRADDQWGTLQEPATILPFNRRPQ